MPKQSQHKSTKAKPTHHLLAICCFMISLPTSCYRTPCLRSDFVYCSAFSGQAEHCIKGLEGATISSLGFFFPSLAASCDASYGPNAQAPSVAALLEPQLFKGVATVFDAEITGISTASDYAPKYKAGRMEYILTFQADMGTDDPSTPVIVDRSTNKGKDLLDKLPLVKGGSLCFKLIKGSGYYY